MESGTITYKKQLRCTAGCIPDNSGFNCAYCGCEILKDEE